ncbi:hypothetical protein Hanom_Chr06g00578461 [Helianthus anomalus]
MPQKIIGRVEVEPGSQETSSLSPTTSPLSHTSSVKLQTFPLLSIKFKTRNLKHLNKST